MLTPFTGAPLELNAQAHAVDVERTCRGLTARDAVNVRRLWIRRKGDTSAVSANAPLRAALGPGQVAARAPSVMWMWKWKWRACVDAKWWAVFSGDGGHERGAVWSPDALSSPAARDAVDVRLHRGGDRAELVMALALALLVWLEKECEEDGEGGGLSAGCDVRCSMDGDGGGDGGGEAAGARRGGDTSGKVFLLVRETRVKVPREPPRSRSRRQRERAGARSGCARAVAIGCEAAMLVMPPLAYVREDALGLDVGVWGRIGARTFADLVQFCAFYFFLRATGGGKSGWGSWGRFVRASWVELKLAVAYA
ncbi:hypothetical protein B0H16DRAFT_1461327 [Mycena metata]|uniref:Uncharacterized protein n=1 Tax=Mycena metata TaxID=1033252 RepID=A0AAD7N8M4_9AGAR|nr:hypothetical protein B0H16DRAFT_1461327 [Mycena metata]